MMTTALLGHQLLQIISVLLHVCQVLVDHHECFQLKPFGLGKTW